MLSRLHLSALLWLSFAVGAVILLVGGVAVQWSWAPAVSTTIMVVTGALLLFEHVAWKWRFLHGWFVTKPNLNGTWRVTLHSKWVNEAGEEAGEIEAYLVVRQTYSHLSLRLFTAESSSEQVTSTIDRATDGVYTVAAAYRNEPRLEVRDRSPMHYGAVLLRVEGDPPEGLRGHYWTDRPSRGEFVAETRLPSLGSSFDDAKGLFSAASA